MRSRAFRPIAVLISALLLAAVPAQASPIEFGQVVNIMGGWQNNNQPDQLRLRAFAQDPSTPIVAGTKSSGSGTQAESLVAPSTASVEPDSQGPIQPTLVAGAEVAAQKTGTDGEVLQTAEVFTQDNIDGTICDCGEIPVAGGGFPKWPLLFLVGIPFFFIHHHHHPPPPTPPPPPPEVPEPTTLLLLGSGLAALGAGARRRYTRKHMDDVVAPVTEV